MLGTETDGLFLSFYRNLNNVWKDTTLNLL